MRGRDNWPDPHRGRQRGRNGRFVKPSPNTPALVERDARSERGIGCAVDVCSQPFDYAVPDLNMGENKPVTSISAGERNPELT